MTEQDLLKAIGNIKDEYIEEAENANSSKIHWLTFGRAAGVLAAGLVLVVSVGVYQNTKYGTQSESKALLSEAENGSDTKVENSAGTTEAEDSFLPADELGAAANADMAAEEIGEMDSIANPFISCETLEDAEKLAGFSFIIPKGVGAYTTQEIYAIENEMIEVLYLDEDDKEGYRIRKGAGVESISGDYNVYENVIVVQKDGRSVTLKGNGDTISLAEWAEGDYAYSVNVDQAVFTEDEILTMIAGIDVVQ